jgi:hypothetical protein
LASSQRSRVWLVEFAGAPAVVKQLVAGPGAADRYAREAAALRLAAGARPAVVPAVLGTDPGARVLVLEYLTGHPTRDERWAVDYATALAGLHATAGDAGLPRWSGPTEADVRAFLDLAGRLGVPVPARADDELRRLLERLRTAGPHALLHGDPCPDNAVHTADGVRFIDLERAALGPGVVELAYPRIAFPTCWCVEAIRPAVLAEAEAAYRSRWSSITGTEPQGDLADACAGWLIQGGTLVEHALRGTTDHLARLPRRDWRWGTATARERLLHRLGVVAGLGADRDGLADVARLCRAMRDRIGQRWPGLKPVPPAFP